MKPTTPFTKSIDVFSDDRGIFAPFFEDQGKDKNKLPTVKRMYYVYNHGTHVIRGFHYHKKEWKYFTIVTGAAKFVAIDPMKPEEKFTFVSSARKPLLIVVPPLFANGWISLEDNTVLVCGSSSTTEESRKDDKRFDPYVWGDVWSVKGR